MPVNIPEFKGTITCGISIPSATRSMVKSKESVGNNGISRYEEAERKRLESLKRQRESYLHKKKLVSSALKSIDHASTCAPVNKKIKFESSSDDEPDDADISAVEPHVNGRKQLFDEDDNSEETEVNFDLDVSAYNGEVGSKLLELQSKIGNVDQRFRLDARFLDDEETDQSDKKKKKHSSPDDDGEEIILKEERTSNMRVLEKILGKQLVKDETSPTKLKQMPYLRYDPENPLHRQFQVSSESEDSTDQEDANEQDSPASSTQGQDEPKSDMANGERRSNIPVGLDPNFAERLRNKKPSQQTDAVENAQPTSTFSLRQLFGRDLPEEEEKDTQNLPSAAAASALDIPDWKLGLMRVRDSSSEDEEEEDAKDDHEEKSGQGDLDSKEQRSFGKKTLFFLYDETDGRIKEGEKFRRMEDMERIRANWEKQRYRLISFYKTRRKEAIKKQKQREGKQERVFNKKNEGDSVVKSERKPENKVIKRQAPAVKRPKKKASSRPVAMMIPRAVTMKYGSTAGVASAPAPVKKKRQRKKKKK